jgi:hypothetical protein
MAKKKGKKGKGRGKKGAINFMRLGGMAGGVLADKKFVDEQLGKFITDPKLKAVAKIALGEYGMKLDFVRGIVKDDNITDGVGAAFTVNGINELMTEMGIAGMGQVDDDTELAVAIEGIDDIDTDDDMSGDDDIDTVNEDVLGDDDDDIDTVNEDVLGDDDDDDDF